MTIAESINLKDSCVAVPDRPRPDMLHVRTGHALIQGSSRVFKQIEEVKHYARTNDMKINSRKTKLMLFNSCTSIDFMPSITFDTDDEIQLVEEMKILGVVISSDM